MSLAFLLACAHTVHLTTVPTGAIVMRGEERLGSDLDVPLLGRASVSVALPGYRTVEVNVKKSMGFFAFLRRRTHVEVRLMNDEPPPESPPAASPQAG